MTLTLMSSNEINIHSSGDQYDVDQADEVSGSVIIYWDVVLLFLRMNELIKDYLIRERN